MSRPSPVPVTLFGGFLGAGKTSVLNHVLASGREGLAVLVNDFGALNIDADLVLSGDADTISLKGGCVCCTVRDDLVEALSRVTRRDPAPRRILVELSGMSEPGVVVRTIAMLERSLPIELDGVVAVVDAEQFPAPVDSHYLLARDQLALADLVILNKIDLTPEARLAELRTRLQKYVPEARLFETTEGRVPLTVLFGPAGTTADAAHEHDANEAQQAHAEAEHEHEHEHAFSSFVYRSHKPMHIEPLRLIATELPRAVFRVKGNVYLSSKPTHATLLQIVGRRARISLGAEWSQTPPETQLVVIGQNPGFDPERVAQAFRRCEEVPTPPLFALARRSRLFRWLGWGSRTP